MASTNKATTAELIEHQSTAAQRHGDPAATNYGNNLPLSISLDDNI
jgi:hypothetical protein